MEMTDKELLKKAAKASGLNVKGEFIDQYDDFTHLCVGEKFTKEKIKWNSLTDDGDAMRLAVKFCFTIEQWQYSVEIKIGDEVIYRALADGTVTRLELTRRAITRAAAAMAR